MPAIPASINLGQLPTAIPSIMFKAPKEGPKSVPYKINWSVPIARNVDCVSINMQDGGTLEFSQICGLIVDNSNCGSDLDFIFPDTDVTISVPAYTPYICLQVNSQQVQFFVRGLAILPGDFTSFSVLNYPPAPVAVPLTKQQQIAGVSNITLDGAAITQLVAATINGTLQNLNVSAAFTKPAAPFNDLIVIRDGTGKTLWAANIAADSTMPGWTGLIGDLQNISMRFSGGLQLVQTGGGAPGGTLNAMAYYVTP